MYVIKDFVIYASIYVIILIENCLCYIVQCIFKLSDYIRKLLHKYFETGYQLLLFAL